MKDIDEQSNPSTGSTDDVERTYPVVSPVSRYKFLWDEPYMAASKRPMCPHHGVRTVSRVVHSIDGSGPWVAVHLLDENVEFVQGGWVPQSAKHRMPQ